jgi:hypothetical protein
VAVPSGVPTPTPAASDATTASIVGHRPGSGRDGGSSGGGAIIDRQPVRPEEPVRDGGVLATSGFSTTVPGGTHRGGPGDLFDAIIGGVADHLGPTVQPAAAVAVAATFGFPLALMLAVVLFLVVQSRLDGRDPKLRAAPLTTADTFLPFVDGPSR